jgi:molecular chaperone Hsp33
LPAPSRAAFRTEKVSQNILERTVSDTVHDDSILSFAAERLHLRGRLVRLGPALDAILTRHAYPEPVARLVGEATVLTALLGSSLKLEGRFQLQTRTDGVVDLIVVDFDAPDRIRAFARFDADKLAAAQAAGRAQPAELLGRGHLGLTIDQGGDMQRYQGVTALAGEGLEEAAATYFAQSEQIPTLVRLAVGRTMDATGEQWRAGGFMAQYLPQSEDRQRATAERSVGGLEDQELIDDAWNEGRALAGTLEAHELLDPALSGERLLYRLFHQNELRVFEPRGLRDQCRCSSEGVRAMLARFSPAERADMVGEDGKIGVTCEFCSTQREFDPASFPVAQEA